MNLIAGDSVPGRSETRPTLMGRTSPQKGPHNVLISHHDFADYTEVIMHHASLIGYAWRGAGLNRNAYS